MNYKQINENVFLLSDKICTALQLINFWQDISKDIKLDRIYIPSEYFYKYRYTEKLLYEGVENENFQEMMKSLIFETENILIEGMNLVNTFKGRLKYELKSICSGGRLIIKKIKNCGYRVLSKKIKLNITDFPLLFIETII